MRSLHAKAVKALLAQMKVHYIYLPPYSPDLNPIEKLWSKVKALLRKFKARSEDRLSDAIRNTFRAVTVPIVWVGSVLVSICFDFENCYNCRCAISVKRSNCSCSAGIFGCCTKQKSRRFSRSLRMASVIRPLAVAAKSMPNWRNSDGCTIQRF